MTEWEKLQSGQVYNDFDEDLFQRRIAAKKLFRAYNRTDVYINFGAVILDCAEVSIGANTLIGPNLGIYPVNHALDPEERAHGGCVSAPVHIGKDAWLGGDVKILAGVSIGDGAVIGMGSVVTKSIPARVVAVGNPCRVLRPITEEDRLGYFRRRKPNV